MTTENDERARLRAILSHPASAKMPRFVQCLAMETSVPATEAATLLTIALSDFDRATAAAVTHLPAQNPPPLPDGIGFGVPSSTESRTGPSAEGGWKKAVATTNRATDNQPNAAAQGGVR